MAVKELTDFFIHYQSKNDQNIALLAERDQRIAELNVEIDRASSSLVTANATVQSISLERDRLNVEVIALRPVEESLARVREELELERRKVAELSDQLRFSEQRHATEVKDLRASIQSEVAAAVREFCRSDQQYALLTERYDGGWKAASLIIKSKYPQVDWALVEEDWLAGLHVTLLKELRDAEAAEGRALESDSVPDYCVENVHPGDLPFSDNDEEADNAE